MSALTEADLEEMHDALHCARARIEHLETQAAGHDRAMQLAYTTGAAHGYDRAVRECIARLEAGFGANCAPVTTLKHHFNVQLVRGRV